METVHILLQEVDLYSSQQVLCKLQLDLNLKTGPHQYGVCDWLEI